MYGTTIKRVGRHRRVLSACKAFFLRQGIDALVYALMSCVEDPDDDLSDGRPDETQEHVVSCVCIACALHACELRFWHLRIVSGDIYPTRETMIHGNEDELAYEGGAHCSLWCRDNAAPKNTTCKKE